MTVETMRDTISNQEYHQWRAYFTWRASMADMEVEKARAQAQVRHAR